MVTKAHQVDVSTTMLVQRENYTWVLQVSASLTAFQHEIRTHFSETPYKTPEEFQQMVLEHMKNNIHFRVNDEKKVTLGNGVVQLGHETKVVFEVFGIPGNIDSIQFSNTAFNDIHRNQSALIFSKEGFDKEHFVLNNTNNHTVVLTVNGNEFVADDKSKAEIFSTYLGLVFIGLLGIGFLLYKGIRK